MSQRRDHALWEFAVFDLTGIDDCVLYGVVTPRLHRIAACVTQKSLAVRYTYPWKGLSSSRLSCKTWFIAATCAMYQSGFSGLAEGAFPDSSRDKLSSPEYKIL